jgi:ribosome-associated heat shock protein Hsp15
MTADAIRIDKLLWFLRLAPSRTLAQSWIEQGHIRVNSRRVERTSHTVHSGDVLTLPTRNGARVITLLALPIRRGPAPEARSFYNDLDAEGSA